MCQQTSKFLKFLLFSYFVMLNFTWIVAKTFGLGLCRLLITMAYLIFLLLFYLTRMFHIHGLISQYPIFAAKKISHLFNNDFHLTQGLTEFFIEPFLIGLVMKTNN